MTTRQRLYTWFRKHAGLSPAAAPDVSPVERESAGIVGLVDYRTVEVSDTGVAATDGEAAPAVPRRRRRRRRSRNSVIGLPLYSTDPSNDEMVLFKHRPSLDSRRSEFDDGTIELPSDGSDARAGSLRSLERSSTDTHAPELDASSPPSSPPSLHYPATPPMYAVEFNDGTSFHPRPRPHRATISFPLPASGSSHFVPPPIGRSRASTLRSIFTRNDGPTAGRSPYGQGFSGSRSTSGLGNISTTSISSLSISAPLQHTLVSSSFIFPKAGLTPQQVSFISSRESLGAYGYGAGAESPPPFVGDSSPPTTSSGFGTRAGRSSSVSTTLSVSSPLRQSSVDGHDSVPIGA